VDYLQKSTRSSGATLVHPMDFKAQQYEMLTSEA
jgi:hypothetical protein